jgi:hypothetical protein
MSSALTQRDEIQLVLPPLPRPASAPARDQLDPPGPLDPGILADIAPGLALSLMPKSSMPKALVTKALLPDSLPDGQDGFESVGHPEGGLRRLARLLHTPAYEAWLIEWEAAADLELHDHGGSRGAFHVVDGALVEAHSDLAAPAPLQTLRIGTDEGREVTATRVHRVWNPGPARAVSVHVYSPPLSSMTFYDNREDTFLAPLRTEIVEGVPEPEAAR